MTKNGGVVGYTEHFCYVLSGKLTSENGSYLMDAVLVQCKISVDSSCLLFNEVI